MTRNSGLVISAALAVEWWLRSRGDWRRGPRLALATVMAPVAGLIGVEAYLALRFGHPLAGVTSQQSYGRHLAFPWEPVLSDLGDLVHGRDLNAVTLLSVLATLGAIAMVVRRRRRQPPAYAVLVLGVLAMQLVYARTFAPHLNSSLRFLATTFPFVQLFALEVGQWLGSTGAARFRRGLPLAAAYLALCAVFSLQFGEKVFVTG